MFGLGISTAINAQHSHQVGRELSPCIPSAGTEKPEVPFDGFVEKHEANILLPPPQCLLTLR